MMIFLFGFSLTGQTNGLIPPSMSLYLCSILHLALDPKGNVSEAGCHTYLILLTCSGCVYLSFCLDYGAPTKG